MNVCLHLSERYVKQRMHPPLPLTRDMIELDVEKRKSAGEGKPVDYSPVVCGDRVYFFSDPSRASSPLPPPSLPAQTRSLVKGVLARAELLLHVTVSQDAFSRSASTDERRSSQEDSWIMPSGEFGRSLSAPPLTAEFGLR